MIKYLCRFCYLLLFVFCLFAEIWAEQWNGDDYAQNSSIQLSYAERLLQNIFWRGDEKVLDIGCGDGKITALIAKKVPQGTVIGIDPSLSMLAKAKEKEASNLSFLEGTAEDFLLDEKFDHIIAIHVMHWVKDQKKALKNIYFHLNPQGQVHLILAPSKEGLPFNRALQKTLKNWSEDFKDFINPQQVFDMESYRKLMVEAGFHIGAIHYVYHKFTHENKEKLKAWVRQWLPHGKYLSGLKQDLFLDELISNYLKEVGLSPETSDRVEWDEYILIIEGGKLS